MHTGKLSSGTKQRARSQRNKNSMLMMRREGVREEREVAESQSLSSADSCGSSGEGVGVSSCDGADVVSSSEEGVASEDEEDEESDGMKIGCGFLDREAEEVWEGSDEEMEWGGESGEEEEEGFVLSQCGEHKGHRRRKLDELETDGSSQEDGEEEENEGEEGSDDGAICEDSEGGESGAAGGSQLPGHLKWKEGLVEKARLGFERRLNSSRYLHKLIYCDPLPPSSTNAGEEEEEEEEVGGLFHVARRERRSELRCEDSSLGTRQLTRDWTACVGSVKMSQFVTGSWGGGDAAALLRGDQEEEAEFGEFEDLETGDKFGLEADEEEGEDKRLRKKKERKVMHLFLCMQCVYVLM